MMGCNSSDEMRISAGRVRPLRALVYGLLFTLVMTGAFARPACACHPAGAADGPTILKNTIHVRLWQLSGAWAPGGTSPDFKYNSWFPQIDFRVLGPVPGGSQFLVDYTRPDGTLWGEINLPTEEIKADQWLKVEANRDTSTAAEKKYTRGVGVYGFKIKIKNELTGTNQVLYTGKFKVGSVSRDNGTPPNKLKVDFYVDHDWALPIGYLYMKPDNVQPTFAASLWFKGETAADLAGYVFYKGKQIASTKDQGSTGTTEAESRTVSGSKGDPDWQLIVLEWFGIADTPKDPNSPNERLFYLDKNPGEYEIKVLRKGTLCRQASFTVGADGKIVISGNIPADGLSPGRRILPVKVLGTLDGTWDKSAYKTEAFYGNPIKEIVIAP